MVENPGGNMAADISERETRTVPRFAEIAADALRFWETRRILYNLALAGVVLAHIYATWPESRSVLSWDSLFALIMLAVLANVCYCAAYAVDLFVQYSGLRNAWPRWRWAVLFVGIVFASTLTHFFVMDFIRSSADPGVMP